MSGTDYYAELAGELRSVADAIETLAGRDPAAGGLRYAMVSLCAGLVRSEASGAVPVVDAIADALGSRAGRSQGEPERYGAEATYGPLEVRVHARVPAPDPLAEADQLRAENERLRARLETSRRAYR